MPGAALRGCRPSRGPAEGRNQHQGLSGRRTGRAPVGLSRTAAGSAGARLGILLLAQRLSPDRPGRNPVQLVPVPGELDRPGALRMDAFQLGRPPRRRHRPLHPAARESRFQRVRVRLPIQAHPHRHHRRGPAVDGRPRLPVAERAVHRQPHRIPRAGRRREHAERHVAFQPGAQGARALRAEPHPDLAGSDRRPPRPGAGSPAM